MSQIILDLDGLTTPVKAASLEKRARQYFGDNEIFVDFVESRMTIKNAQNLSESDVARFVRQNGLRTLPSRSILESQLTVEVDSDEDSLNSFHQTLRSQTGIEDYFFDAANGRLRILHEASYSPVDLVCQLSAQGYIARLVEPGLNDRLKNVRDYGAVLATTMLVIGSVLSSLKGLSSPWTVVPFFIAILVGMWPLLEDGIIAAFQKKRLNYASIIFVFSAVAVSEQMWFETAFVVTTLSIALFLERQFFRRIRLRLFNLRLRLPQHARVIEDNIETMRGCSQLQPGQTVVVGAGDYVPVDGYVVSGSAGVRGFDPGVQGSERLTKGDKVFAGYRVLDGEIQLEAASTQAQSRWAVFLQDLHASINSIFPEWRRIRQWVLLFSTICISFALVIIGLNHYPVEGYEFDIVSALALLLVSGPVAISSTTQGRLLLSLLHLAERGVLIKKGESISRLAGLQRFFFDKQGVITKGQAHVEEVIAMHGDGIKDLLRIAASLVDGKVHDYFRAIVMRAVGDDIQLCKVKDTQQFGEQGFSGVIEGEHYCFGTYRLIKEQGLSNYMSEQSLERWQQDGVDVLFLANSRGVIGVFNVIDPIQYDAALSLDGLHALGVEHLVLMTEDNQKSAGKLAHRLGFDAVDAQMATEEKQQKLAQITDVHSAAISARAVLMEAKKLLRFSIRSRLREPEYELGDVVVLGDELQLLPESVSTAKRSLTQLRNLSLVFIGYKLTIIAAVMAQVLPLWVTMLSELLFTYVMWLTATREGLLQWVNPAIQPKSIMQLPPPRRQRIFSPGLIR